MEVAQGADQPFPFRRRSTVGQISKRRAEIEDTRRQRPAKRQVARALGVGDEANEQRAAVGAIWRLLAELVAPQPERLPRAQLMRYEADDIGTLSRLRDELEVVQPDFVEGQLSRSHGRPTS